MKQKFIFIFLILSILILVSCSDNPDEFNGSPITVGPLDPRSLSEPDVACGPNQNPSLCIKEGCF